MSIALKGLITGIAEGVSSKIDKEREDAKNRVAVRTKNAYENYVKYQEQAAALRAEIKKKDALALQFQPDLTEEERIAIATMPNAIDLYQEAVRNGKQVTLRDVVKVGDKAKGMKYADFIETLGKVEPAAQVQMGERTSVFAPSEERQRQMLDKLSTSVGVSAPELMAFEKPREAPSVAPMGSLSMELFAQDRQPTSRQAMAESLRVKATQARLTGNMDEAEQLNETAASIEAEIEKPAESLEKEANQIRLKLIDDPQNKKLQTRLTEVEDSLRAHAQAKKGEGEGKQKSVASINSSVKSYVANRMREDTGASWYKFTEPKTLDLGGGNVITFRGAKVDMPVEEQRKMFAQERAYTLQALKDNRYVDARGAPLYDAVQEVMNNYGLSGTPLPTAAPAQPAPTAPVAASAAQQGKTRTRAQVEAVAASRGVSYEEAKAAAQQAGIRVIE